MDTVRKKLDEQIRKYDAALSLHRRLVVSVIKDIGLHL